MKIQKVLSMTAGLLIGSVSAGAAINGDSAYVPDDPVMVIQPVTPVYLDDVAGNLSFYLQLVPVRSGRYVGFHREASRLR